MKLSKKILSLCLAMMMVFSVTGTAFAAESEKDCPVVHIPGFYSSNVYGDLNDPDTLLVLPSTDVVIDFVKDEFVPALLNFCVDRDTDKLATDVCEKINEQLFPHWFNESTGDAKEGSGIIFDATPENVTASSELTFRFDWRGDMVDIADDLAEYIDYVLAESGCEKLALSAHSFGSNLILAYLAKYGNEKISAIVFDSPACDGVAVVGNLMTGKVTLDAEFLGYFLESTLGENEYAKLISGVYGVLELADIPGTVVDFLDEAIEVLAPAVYKETLAPLFGYWPAIWAMVPDSQIDEAMAYIFDDILKEQDLSVLRGRVEEYNALVRANKEVTLRAFDSVGNFAVLSRYGSPAFPLTDASDLMGDTVIETKASSLGATTAPVGTYFTEEETEGVDAKYISPDRTVNASTCLFPEQTWFIKDSGHFETHFTDDYYNLFLFAEKELTCDDTEFGRFCTFETENYTLVKDTSEPEQKENDSPLARLFRFLAALFETFTALIKKLFS
ncbi:MAG: alpha/beta hydrolase [Ruminococcaceae bacterium]|nr:alpha/beta hydrolase [Oscillospiraceae bacterium]